MYNLDSLGFKESVGAKDVMVPLKIPGPEHPVRRKVELTENWTEDDLSVRCLYNGQPRPVHPAVCELHRHMEDPECELRRCPRRTPNEATKKLQALQPTTNR